MTSAERVSACLIAKNEERFLPDCLRSLQSRVEEVIVADTGSTDKTVEIAQDFGASVIEHPWQENFSEARNAAMAHASGDWILYIDADERLVAPVSGFVADHLPGPDAPAARLLLQPRIGYTVYSELRLFRNDPRIQFRGVMHERVVETVRAVCEADGRQVKPAHGIRLDHVGYEGDQSHKHVRNEPLLRKALKYDPDRVYCWFHLGLTLKGIGQMVEAEECLKEAYARALDGGVDEELSIASSCCQHWAEQALAAEDTALARHWTAAGLKLCHDNYSLIWMQARAALAEGNAAEALRVSAPLGQIDPDLLVHETHAFAARLFTVDTPALQGAAYFELGDTARAETCFAQAARAAENPAEQLEFRTKQQLAHGQCLHPDRDRQAQQCQSPSLAHVGSHPNRRS